jgi:acyl-CoA dehydrogenase
LKIAPSPWIDEELALLSDQVAKFAARALTPHAARWERERVVDRGAWRRAGAAGLLCASIPEKYGGGGGHFGHEAVIAQELTRAGLGASFGAGLGVSSGLVAHYILAYGTEEQRLRWLPRMATGEIVGAVAMSEPGAGSDLQGLRTRARREGESYVIDGQKTFISNGQSADLIVVVAKTDQEARAKGVSLFVVETDQAEGFKRGRNLDKLGMHGQDTSELFFDAVRVPADHLLGGEEGRGFVQLMEQLAWERLVCALGAVLNMERAVEITVDYTKGRAAFGKSVFDFQNTQFVLADCAAQVLVGRTLVDQLMVRLLAGELDGDTAAMAKLWTTEAVGRVTDACLQLHGGYGYMAEYEIARLWADSRVMRIFAGTNEIMRLIIARSL